MFDNWDERNALAGIAMGTLNTCLLVGLLVFGLYLTSDLGGLLDGLSTVLGLAIFGLLWVVTCFCTYGAWRDSGGSLSVDGPPPRFIGPSIKWGAINGMLLFNALLAGLIAVIVAAAAAEGEGDQVGAAIAFGTIGFGVGTVASSIVGAVLGMVFGLVDLILLDAARSLAGVRGRESVGT